jgi:hypothetical protein
MFKRGENYTALLSLMAVSIVLGGCMNQDDATVQKDESNALDWHTENIPEFGINYPIPPNAHVSAYSPHLVIVDKGIDHLYSVATLNAGEIRSSVSYAADPIDWNYFLSHQPLEGVGYNKIGLSWNQYHSIKDTFTPNVVIGDIPMYIEFNYGKLSLSSREPNTEHYYFRAHFFIQNGLNYVRITLPVNVPEDILQNRSKGEVLKLIQYDQSNVVIQEQKDLFNEILQRINIDNKFLSANWEDEKDLACQTTLDSSAVGPKIKLANGLKSAVRVIRYQEREPDDIRVFSMDDQHEYNEIFSNINVESDYQNFEYRLMDGLLIRTRANRETGTKRYDLYGFAGETINGCYSSALSTTQALKYKDANKYLYTQPLRTKDRAPNNVDPVIFVSDNEGNVVDTVKSMLLPNWTISSSRIVGWSSDLTNIYITRIGWEGYEMGDLWKVDVENKIIEHITSAEEIALGALNVLPEKDLAVGIRYTEVKCDDCMGSTTGGVPNSIQLFDLKNNTVRTVYSSRVNLVSSPLLTPDGSRIYFVETLPAGDRTLFSIKIDGTELVEIAKNRHIQGISKDGNTLILQEYAQVNNYAYQIMDVASKNVEEHQIHKVHEDDYVEFMSCIYPLGFNCLY